MKNVNVKRAAALVTASCLCLSLAACGQPASQSTASGSSSSESSSAAGAADTAETSTASGSGKVTVYMPSPAGLADKLAEAFTAKTGIQVEQFQGTTGEILARLETEAANPVADVVILASWSDGLSMKADDQIISYTPANADKINDGWVDEDSMLFGYSASAVGVIYNTTIYPELNADWADLADAQYADDIAIPDPEKSGACKDFLAGLVTGLDNGSDILQSWADNGLTVPGANAAALESVTTGEKGILIAGVDYNAYSSIDDGEPIDIYYPASGTVVNPRPAMTVAPEVEGVQEIIREFSGEFAIAIGHSGADYATAREAIANGAKACTHTFNGMRLFHQHHPAIMGAVLASPDVYCEAICDGRHLHPGTVEMLLQCKGLDRVVAITDSIQAAGLPDGNYKLGVNDVVVVNGDAQLANGGGRAVYYGDVSAHLANLVIRKLGIKARSEKPGIAGRASAAYQSRIDREEAVEAGSTAVRAAVEGKNGVMVGFRRLPGAEYRVETILIPIEEVMLHERTMPKEFIADNGHDVTQAFLDWCRPLLGEPVRKYVTFKNRPLSAD